MSTRPPGQDPSLLRRINTAQIVRVLRQGETFTVAEIATRMGLSRRTTEQAVVSLARGRWVTERMPESSGPAAGRPARRFSFNAGGGGVVGVDITSERITATLADLDGARLADGIRELRPDDGADRIVAALERLIGDLLREAPATDLLAIGVSSTGIVSASGTVVESRRIPALSGHDVAEPLRARFGVPVIVENDCRTALMAEQWRGAARDVADVVYLSIGSRPGCAFTINGALYRGAEGASGELGSLDALGWPALARLVSEGDGGVPSVRDVARTAALSLAAVTLVLNPSAVVVACPELDDLDELLAALASEVDDLGVRPLPLRAARVTGDASLIGAIRLALDDAESRLLLFDDDTLRMAD